MPLLPQHHPDTFKVSFAMHSKNKGATSQNIYTLPH